MIRALTVWNLLFVTLTWAACVVASYALALDAFARRNPVLYSWRYRVELLGEDEARARAGTRPNWRRTKRWAALWSMSGPIALTVCVMHWKDNGWPLITEDRDDDWGKAEREEWQRGFVR